MAIIVIIRDIINQYKGLLMRKYRVLDLFCGAGGFSEGFRQAGYKIAAGVDNDVTALNTYSRNFPEALAIEKDLSVDINNRDFMKELSNNKIDVIIGGPPCQGFSLAGKRLKDDPRNRLYIAYISLIKLIRPKAVLLENVPSILGLYNGEIAKQIIEDFTDLGYNTQVFKLLASNFYIPQNRKRALFVGLRGKSKFKIPPQTSSESPVTSSMAISDLPLLNKTFGGEILKYTKQPMNDYQREMRRSSKYIYNHWSVIHNKSTIDIIKLVPDGGNYKDLPRKLQGTRKVNIAWTRMNSKKPCFTIDAGHNHHFHYKANRVPTVRECARIQSFPDRFRFYGLKSSQFRQVGNAVPPLLAKTLAVSLKEALYDI